MGMWGAHLARGAHLRADQGDTKEGLRAESSVEVVHQPPEVSAPLDSRKLYCLHWRLLPRVPDRDLNTSLSSEHA